MPRRTQRTARRAPRNVAAIVCAFVLVGATAYAMPGVSGAWNPLARPVLAASFLGQSMRDTVRFSFTDTDLDAPLECSLDGAPPSPCTSPKFYRGPLQAGRHTFRVRAFEPSELEISPFTSYAWSVVGLPAPGIIKHPADPTNSTSASFALADRRLHGPLALRRLHMRLECRLDGRTWKWCGPRTTYQRLSVGEHSFLARVVGSGGQRSKPAVFRWRVMASSGEPFSIVSASVPGVLMPGGAALPIPITLSNPGDAPLYVSSIRVGVVSSPPGCPAGGNLMVWQSNASPAAEVEVAAHASVTLPAQGVLPPEIALRDLPINQDACRNGAFRFELTGKAGS